MVQRRLSKQQKSRIRAQQERNRQQTVADDHRFEGLVIQHHGKQAIVEDEGGALIVCKIRQNLGHIVCGDSIIFQREDDDAGVILAVQPRNSVLARPDFRRRPKPFAANIDQIVIVAATEPELSEHLLDRYLVVLESIDVSSLIVINKIDLPDTSSYEAIKSRMAVYETLGYRVIYTSVSNHQGIDELCAALQDHTSILVGQSGVGKSSLINLMLPDLELRIGQLSQANHGKHTTSSSTLYHLPFGGDIIDSPGVRDFGIWHIDETSVANGFREFKPYLGQCRFYNCRHTSEPGCAIKQAAERGQISARRLQSYQQMLYEISAD